MPDFSVTIAVCAHRDIKASVFESLWALGSCPNPKVTVHVMDGDALISRSRSRAATKFLKDTKDDLLMFIDDDVVISTIDATKLMWEAWQLKLPVLGAAYVTKSKENPGFAIRPLNTEVMKFGTDGEIYEVRSVSTGCMIIRREVLEKFVKDKVAPFCVHGSIGYYPFFQHEKMVIDGIWEDISEDWYFCEKAKWLGYKVWCDTTIKLGHIGPYEYNWDDLIETKKKSRQKYDAYNFNLIVPNENSPLKEQREAVTSSNLKGETINA